MAKKNKELYIVKNTEKIVYAVRRFLEPCGWRANSMATLTYKNNPSGLNTRGVEHTAVYKIARQLIKKGSKAVLICFENDEKRNHYHIISDKILTLQQLRESWKHGFVKNEFSNKTKAVLFYIFKKMTCTSNNFRLFINLTLINYNPNL